MENEDFVFKNLLRIIGENGKKHVKRYHISVLISIGNPPIASTVNILPCKREVFTSARIGR